MNAIQQYLFPELLQPLAAAQRQLHRFRNESDAQKRFLSTIAAKLIEGGPGSLVVANCSPAVQQDLLAEDIGKLLPGTTGGSNPAKSEAILRFSAPPEVTSARDQLRTLHERYRVEADQLWIRYQHKPLFSDSGMVFRTTETEALVDMLRSREIKLVCITSGEHLLSSGAAKGGRVLNHIADLARRSRVHHVVFGTRAEMAQVSRASRAGMLQVHQPLYDSNDDAHVELFVSIVNGYDHILRDCSNIRLATRGKSLMTHVGGDPCRLARWLVAAVCEAAQQGASKLDWGHVRATQPDRAEVNRASMELHQSKRWSEDDDSDGAATPTGAVGPKPRGGKRRRPGRKLTIDGVAVQRAA